MDGNLKREFAAELLGTFVLMVCGLGVNAQVTLGTSTVEIAAASPDAASLEITQRAHGDFFTINTGWGIAVILGVYVCGGITGAHINPAVSVAMAFRKELPWRKVGPYIGAQMIGAFLATWLVYLVYAEQIEYYDRPVTKQATQLVDEAAAVSTNNVLVPVSRKSMETAAIWSTYPRDLPHQGYVSNWTGLLDQIVGTAILLLCICAMVDKGNMAPGNNVAPITIGLIVFMVGMAFGSNCGYAINPARDLSPRLFSYIAGWKDVFMIPNTWWYIIPVVGPVIGGVLGVVLYDQLISRFNFDSLDRDLD